MSRLSWSILIIGLLFIGGVLSALSWAVHVEDSRWPALADTPLPTPGPVSVPADAQAWTLLLQAAEQVDALPDESRRRIEDALDAEGAPLDAAHWALAGDALDTLEQAMAPVGLSVPQPQSFEDPMPPMIPLLTLGKAASLRGWHQLSRGAEVEGAGSLLVPVQLGHRVRGAAHGVVVGMVGVALQKRGLEELWQAMDGPLSASRDAHVVALAGLLPLLDPPPALPRLLAEDCALTDQAMADPDLNELGVGSAMLYDAELTRVWGRLRCSELVDEARAPLAGRGEPPGPDVRQPTGDAIVARLHNPAGRILYGIAQPDMMRYVAQEDLLDAALSVHVVALAARLYAIDHGGLPEDAQALVPDYLWEVPPDRLGDGPLVIREGRVGTVGANNTDWWTESEPLLLELELQ